MAGFDNEKPVEEIFSERLKIAMKSVGTTAKEVSANTGVTRSTLSSYVTGRRAAGLLNVYLIAKELDVSIDWLCGLSDVPSIQGKRIG